MKKFRLVLSAASLAIGAFAAIQVIADRAVQDTPVWALMWFGYLALLYSVPNAGASKQISGVVFMWPIVAMAFIIAMQSFAYLYGSEPNARLAIVLRVSLFCAGVLALIPPIRSGLGERSE